MFTAVCSLRLPTADMAVTSQQCLGNWEFQTGIKRWQKSTEIPHFCKWKQKKGMFFLNILYWASVLGHEIAIILSGSSSVVDPDDYKLCEWLFPWFCGFVQLEQWPHCNPRLFTFQQISSYWNHGEGRAGVKEDSHAPYLYKTNICLTQGPHLVNNPQWFNMKGWQCVINTSLTKISFILFPLNHLLLSQSAFQS